MFKDMKKWVEIRRHVLTGEISKRAACKKYGLQWRTLQRVLAYEEPAGYQRKEPRQKPKLAPFLPIIHEILQQDRKAPKKQRHTAQRIFDRLRTEHHYDGGLTIVKDAVRAWKQRGAEVFVPLTMKKLETKSMVLLKHHLKALKLPTIHAECDKVACRCAMDNVDHLGFLLQLCELELIEREKRAAERRLKAARFPNLKTLDTFDFTAQPSLNRMLVMELLRCAYLDNRESVILIGNPGTGKTHVATALAVEACGRGNALPGASRNTANRNPTTGRPAADSARP